MVDTFDDLDIWKDTVIVLTADHGEMGGTHGGQRGKGPFCYENNAHVPMVIVHPDAKGGKSCAALTSHLDLLPTFVGLAKIPDDKRPDVVKKLPGRDFSTLLRDPESAKTDAIRPGILFNYVSPSTIDANFNIKLFLAAATGKKSPPITEVDVAKRGFLAFTFDGRYKLGRYYAPNAFNTPKTLDQLFKHNDVQVFDLQNPEESFCSAWARPSLAIFHAGSARWRSSAGSGMISIPVIAFCKPAMAAGETFVSVTISDLSFGSDFK